MQKRDTPDEETDETDEIDETPAERVVAHLCVGRVVEHDAVLRVAADLAVRDQRVGVAVGHDASGEVRDREPEPEVQPDDRAVDGYSGQLELRAAAVRTVRR